MYVSLKRKNLILKIRGGHEIPHGPHQILERNAGKRIVSRWTAMLQVTSGLPLGFMDSPRSEDLALTLLKRDVIYYRLMK